MSDSLVLATAGEISERAAIPREGKVSEAFKTSSLGARRGRAQLVWGVGRRLASGLRDQISRISWVESIFDIAALVGFASIIAHGLTDHPAAEWMARHSEAERAREETTKHHRGEPRERAPTPR